MHPYPPNSLKDSVSIRRLKKHATPLPSSLEVDSRHSPITSSDLRFASLGDNTRVGRKYAMPGTHFKDRIKCGLYYLDVLKKTSL